MKIAIIRLSALGDIIVSASLVSCLTELFADIEIDWFVDERFAAILKPQDRITLRILPLKRHLKNFNIKAILKEYQELRCLSYDAVIDMQGLIKSAIIGRILKSRYYVGFDRNSIKEPFASFFYTHKVEIPYQDSIVRRNAKVLFEALKPSMSFDDFLSFALKKRKQIFTYNTQDKHKILQYLSPNKKNILFILEASMPSKTYSSKNFIQLGRGLSNGDISILLLVHRDFSKAQEIFDGLKDCIEIKIISQLDLQTIKALIDSVDLVVGGDTGITHLAWAMQKPSITLYGNTPLERFKLLGDKNIALSGNPKATYDKNDFSINKISPQQICKYIEDIL